MDIYGIILYRVAYLLTFDLFGMAGYMTYIHVFIMDQLIFLIIVDGIIKDQLCKNSKRLRIFIIVQELYAAMPELNHLSIFANILI